MGKGVQMSTWGQGNGPGMFSAELGVKLPAEDWRWISLFALNLFISRRQYFHSVHISANLLERKL